MMNFPLQNVRQVTGSSVRNKIFRDLKTQDVVVSFQLRARGNVGRCWKGDGSKETSVGVPHG